MKYRVFSVPAAAPDGAEEALNRFCAEHRVVNVDKEFVQAAGGSYWAFCVCYLDGPTNAYSRKPRIDYREILSEHEFAIYAKLRNLRKTVAQEEGIPAYALFTNEQLAAMVQGQVMSRAALAEIDGIGAARVEKYGDAFLAMLREGAASAESSADKGSDG